MSESLQSLLTRVARALAEGRLQDAAGMLNRAQQVNANDPRIFMLGGQLGRRAGNPGAAVMALRRAVALAPGWALAHTELGHALALAGRPDEALAVYRLAQALDPDNAAVAARIRELSSTPTAAAPTGPATVRQRAAQLLASGQLDDAASLLQSLLETAPQDVDALTALASIERARGDTEAAVQWLERALAIEPNDRTLRFRHAVLRGETPPDMPTEIVAHIFDVYAEAFDEHLVGALQYRAHEGVVAMMRARSLVASPDILDLGCGTGLVGAALSPPFGRLVGVDLSSGMLERAGARSVYTELHHADLSAYLHSCPDTSFDAVTAADVFVYIGNLGPALAEVSRAFCGRAVLLYFLSKPRWNLAIRFYRPAASPITASTSKTPPATPTSTSRKSSNAIYDSNRA